MTISSSQKIYDFVEMKSSFFCLQRLDFQSRILFGLGCLILYSLCKLLKDYQNKPSRSHRENILLSLSNLNAAKTSKTPISTITPIPPPIRLQICSQSHSILLKYITTIRLNTYTTKHTFELRADRPMVLSVRCEPRQQVYSVATTLAATRVVSTYSFSNLEYALPHIYKFHHPLKSISYKYLISQFF